MLRPIKKLPSRQTINRVGEANDQSQENGPTESQPSIPLNENLSTDRDTGREATLGKFSGQNHVFHRPSVIISPRNSRSNRKFAVHRPKTLNEEVPESPCSTSSLSLPQAYSSSTSRFSTSIQSPDKSPIRTSTRPSTSTLSNLVNLTENESARSSRPSILKTKNQPSLTPSPSRKSYNESPLRSPIVSISKSPIGSPGESINSKSSKTWARSSPKSTSSSSSPRGSLPISNLNWKKSKYSEQIEHTIIMKDGTKGLVLGMFRFFGKCEKPNQKTADFRTTYILMKGLISIKIGDEPYMTINELESVSIPEMTCYQIKNLIDGESVLQFYIC